MLTIIHIKMKKSITFYLYVIIVIIFVTSTFFFFKFCHCLRIKKTWMQTHSLSLFCYAAATCKSRLRIETYAIDWTMYVLLFTSKCIFLVMMMIQSWHYFIFSYFKFGVGWVTHTRKFYFPEWQLLFQVNSQMRHALE